LDILKIDRVSCGKWLQCRTRRLAVLVLLLVTAGWMASGAQPEVLQPESYNTSQRGVLSAAAAALESLLSDSSLGSRMRLGERAWTSREFAAFTDGVLDQFGYEAVVVSGHLLNERHLWVLVGVDVGDATAWVPVEATPVPGAVQNSLGHVTWGGAGLYAQSYLQYDHVVDIGSNLAPVAAVSPPTSAPLPGELASFLAVKSRDPDGEIILYIWEVDGDRRPTMTKTWSYEHVFEQEGTYTVTLTVVDNRGVRAATVVSVDVYDNENDAPDQSDCGCSG